MCECSQIRASGDHGNTWWGMLKGCLHQRTLHLVKIMTMVLDDMLDMEQMFMLIHSAYIEGIGHQSGSH